MLISSGTRWGFRTVWTVAVRTWSFYPTVPPSIWSVLSLTHSHSLSPVNQTLDIDVSHRVTIAAVHIASILYSSTGTRSILCLTGVRLWVGVSHWTIINYRLTSSWIFTDFLEKLLQYSKPSLPPNKGTHWNLTVVWLTVKWGSGVIPHHFTNIQWCTLTHIHWAAIVFIQGNSG